LRGYSGSRQRSLNESSVHFRTKNAVENHNLPLRIWTVGPTLKIGLKGLQMGEEACWSSMLSMYRFYNLTNDDLRLLDEALEAAFSTLKNSLQGRGLPESEEITRERLAIAIFSAAESGERDMLRLRDSAVYDIYRRDLLKR
jgi:hypothetical protein